MNLGGTVRLNKFGVIFVITILVLLFYYMNRNNAYQTRTVNLRHLLYVSIEIAERGGLEIVKVKNENSVHESSKGKTKEGANIPVTTADIKSHCAMVYPLMDLFPHIKVISEEKDLGSCDQTLPIELESKGLPDYEDVEVPIEDIVVWIDPLDATQEFTEDLLDYVTTMVCVAYKGYPVIGVIHKPFAKTQKTYWAWKNKGFTSQLLHQTTQQMPDNSETFIISRSHTGEAETAIKEAFGNKAKIVKAGGSGYKVLQLIGGNATVYTHVTDIHKWDICAGDAILTSLGGRFSNLEDDDIYYNAHSTYTNTRGVLATMQSHQDKHMKIAQKLYETIEKLKKRNS